VVEDPFWTPKLKITRDVTIPDCLAKFEKDGVLSNFDKIRDGVEGEHSGPPWYDGLTYEMIRAAADFLAAQPDPALESRLDEYIQHIADAAAKDPDGYLNTYTQLKEPTHRWGLNGGNDNWQHDLYNAGCLIEAGVHYYRATGKAKLLTVAVKLANHMCDVMGPPPRKNVIPGHSMVEEALVRLYQLVQEQPKLKDGLGAPVDEQRYLELARFFIEARGHWDGRTSFGAYGQDDRPVFEQPEIEGHAVRATLMCAGVAAIAYANQSDEYCRTARRLWDNLAERKLYITGGSGATAEGEAFAQDYVLPNTGYLETCAAVGTAFFSRNMNLAFAEARYVDELERELYNAALAGVSLAGNTYTYVNPLQFDRGEQARWAWHGCPCCPPMFAKVMGALPGYIYATDEQGVYVNLFVGSRAELKIHEKRVSLHQATEYPWDGVTRITLDPEQEQEFDLHIRIPAWCQAEARESDLYQPEGRPVTGAFAVSVNGQPTTDWEVTRGYATLRRTWQRGDVVEVTMEMPIRRVKSHPNVASNAGSVALMRGPLVYALETTGDDVRAGDIYLPADAALTAVRRPDLLGGVTTIKGEFHVRSAGDTPARVVELEAVPYFSYGNRGNSDGRVWIPETAAQRDARMAWWREARFGMFVHWGLYSGLAGTWDGKAVGTSGGMEWIQNYVKADTDTYAAAALPLFKPKADFAKDWARLAKQAGCRYIVFTTKHHEGFALHDSAVSDYDAGSKLHRDLVKEIVEAARAEGLRVGFYHSVIDWHHDQYEYARSQQLPHPLHGKPYPNGKRDHAKYVDYLHAEVNELVSNYGPVDVLWWDYSAEDFQGDEAWRSTDLMQLVRSKQPEIIMNNRLFRSEEAGWKSMGTDGFAARLDSGYGDFITPEQHIPATGMPGVDWETCMTLNTTWGYSAHDHAWKTSDVLIRNLVDIASKGGNYLLNIGPQGDGSLTPETVKAFQAVGDWMRVNNEAIYGTTASPFPELKWGRCTQKQGTLYLHVFEWPQDGILRVPGLKTGVRSARLLAGGDALQVEQGDNETRIHVPAAAPDAVASVIRVELVP
jgi:DUF1680 family protein/alpha-L-fucosidase